MIQARGLTKRYGDKVAVDDFSFTVQPGHGHRLPGPQRRRQVHDHADDPRPRRSHLRLGDRQREALRGARSPLHEVGALLEARAVHTGRSARNHLLVMAATAGIVAAPR